MRWRGGLQTGDQSELRNLPKVGVLVGAVLGLVPELSLDGLDGVAARGSLAGHRMAAHVVVTELAKTEPDASFSGRLALARERLFRCSHLESRSSGTSRSHRNPLCFGPIPSRGTRKNPQY